MKHCIVLVLDALLIYYQVPGTGTRYFVYSYPGTRPARYRVPVPGTVYTGTGINNFNFLNYGIFIVKLKL